MAIVVMIAVVSGFIPQVTSLLHFYIALSFVATTTIPDGGDQLTVFFTAMLIPLCVTCPTFNMWSGSPRSSRTRTWLAWLSIAMIHVQMSYLYFDSAFSKTKTAEWANGTHSCYLNYGYFTPGPPFDYLWRILTSSPIGTAATTWIPIAIEALLFTLIFVRSKRVRLLLGMMGVLLHLSIALFLGISSFQMVMIGCLVIYTLPIGSAWYSISPRDLKMKYRTRARSGHLEKESVSADK